MFGMAERCIPFSTNVQRIVSGVVNYTARNDEATFAVKYAGATNYEVTLNVLDTDYDSFAVVWACSSIAGPVGHTGFYRLRRKSFRHPIYFILSLNLFQNLCGF